MGDDPVKKLISLLQEHLESGSKASSVGTAGDEQRNKRGPGSHKRTPVEVVDSTPEPGTNKKQKKESPPPDRQPESPDSRATLPLSPSQIPDELEQTKQLSPSPVATHVATVPQTVTAVPPGQPSPAPESDLVNSSTHRKEYAKLVLTSVNG